MRSATSLFSPAIGRKSLLRYWPVWTSYTVIWLLLMPGSMPSHGLSDPGEISGFCDDMVRGMMQAPSVILTAVFSIFAAMAVWSYLMNPRAAAFYHALPVRREGLFLTQYLTGLGFLAGPAIVTALVTLLTEAMLGNTSGGGLVFQWLLAVLLLSFFFFSLASFCAFLTGHVVALPILYVLLNSAVIVVEYLIRNACETFFRGVEVGAPRLMKFSPIVWLMERGTYMSSAEELRRYFDYLGWLAAAAVLLTVCGFLLCKRRHTETAGDVIAVSFLRPVFRYVFALGCSVVLGSVFFAVLSINYGGSPRAKFVYTVCLLAGGAIGYLAAEMMLQKKFRVLRKSWKGLCAVLAVVLTLSLTVSCDLFGVERWIPDAENVRSITLNGNTFSDPEDVEKIITLHQMTVAAGEDSSGGYAQIGISYEMKDGKLVRRNYNSVGQEGDIADPSTPVGLCAEIMNGEKAICSRVLPPEGASVKYITFFVYTDDAERTITLSTQEYAGLFAAIKADAAKGTLDSWNGFYGDSNSVVNMQIVWYYTNDTQTGNYSFDICQDDENTLAFLKNKGYME